MWLASSASHDKRSATPLSNARRRLAIVAIAVVALIAPSAADASFTFSAHTFTTCGAAGQNGPSQDSCRNSYSTAWDDSDSNFTVSSGIQYWTVPYTGIYEISAAGARGGGNYVTTYGYGKGATATGRLALTEGQKLKILVGQRGSDGGNNFGGGGGGTFVTTDGNEPLVIAGGGGGAGRRGNYDYARGSSMDGQTSTTGGQGIGIYASSSCYYNNSCNISRSNGGSGGYGGSYLGVCNYGGPGGGGLLGAGSSYCNGSGGQAFVSGGQGGYDGGCSSAGGFGGGGGGYCGYASGGGGGYSGGGGGGNTYCYYFCDGGGAGGGGSFIAASATNTSLATGSQSDGSVTITRLGPPPPTLTIDGTSPTKSTSATVRFSGVTGNTFECSLDGAAFASCTSPKTVTGLADGGHSLDVRQIQSSLSLPSPPTTVQWTVDTTAPAVQALDPAVSTPTNVATFDYSLTFNESVVGVEAKDFTVSGTAGGWKVTSVTGSGAGPYTVTVSSPAGSKDGTVSIALKSGSVTDTAGNSGPATVSAASSTITSDRTAPALVALTGAPALPTQTTPTFSLTGKEDTATYECSVNGADYTGCDDGYSPARPDGVYTITARQRDAAGNAGPATAAASWTIDTTAPAAPAITQKSPDNKTAPSVTFTGETGATFVCSLDGADYSACTSPTQLTGLTDGDHNLKIRQTDVAGNTSAAASTDWTVDTKRPDAPLVTDSVTTTIASGGSHSCAVMKDATVRCWGNNNHGQLGDGSNIDRTSPVAVVGVTNAIQVTTGATHSCALLDDGSVKCWGNNDQFQVGDGAGDPRYTDCAGGSYRIVLGRTDANPLDRRCAVTVPDVSSAIQVTAGDSHTCALINDGSVKCWGYNGSGQLGYSTWYRELGTRRTFHFPEVVSWGHANRDGCSRNGSRTGSYVGYAPSGGYDSNGQTSGGYYAHRYSDYEVYYYCDRTQPANVTVSGVSSATQIAAGSNHTCALLNDQTVRCWGAGGNGQAGDGNRRSSADSVAASGLSNAIQITAGAYHTCALLEDRSARCWGLNDSGQIGDATTTQRSTPVAVSGVSSIDQIVAGGNHTCALISGGTTKCWGLNSSGQVGDNTTTSRTSPTSVAGITGVTQLAAGSAQTCAATSDGSTKCWGSNSNGQLGFRPSRNASGAVRVHTIATGSQIAAGDKHSCVLLTDSSVKCWGSNGYSQLGDGTTVNRGTPTPVGSLNATQVTAGGNHTCVLLSGGTAKCWGLNSTGELGDRTTTSRTVPTNVEKLSGAAQLAAGANHTCARMTDATVKCWGDNRLGQLGDKTTVPRYQPTVASGITGATQIATGASHSCALLTGASVKCWGYNANGQVGDGTTTNRTSGIVVAGAAGASSIAAGASHTCAAISTGTIKCWGANSSGQLGDGTTTDRSAPVAVVGVSDAKQVATGRAHSCALLNDGSVKCWGDNSNGQLGDGTTVARTDATKVAGVAAATQIVAGTNHTCAVETNGRAVCWGANDVAQLGDGTTTVNLSPTVAAVSAKPGGSFSERDARISFSGEGDNAITCSIDGAAYAACESPLALLDLADGNHTVAVKQTDAAGNSSDATTLTWTVDNAAAAPVITSAPAALVKQSDAAVSFTGEDSATFACSLDGAAFAACSSPYQLTSLPDGNHTVAVRQTDVAGNTSVSASTTWRSDTTAPAPPSLTTTPASPTSQTSGSVSFSGEVNATYLCSIDDGAFAACTSAFSASSLKDGDHAIAVKQTDQAGNTGVVATARWTIDTVAPAAPTLTNSGAAVTNQTTTTLTFSGEDKATLLCSLDSNPYTACTNPQRPTALTEGAHSYSVKQRDQAGNTSGAATTSWTVDTTPPAAPSLSGAPNGSVSQTSLTATITAATGMTLECRLDSLDWSSCQSPYTASDLGDRIHRFEARQIDQAGNAGPAASAAWTVDKVAPDSAVQVTTGNAHSCGIGGDNGDARCWGYNDDGESVTQDLSVLDISAGANHTCALTISRSVKCWGFNKSGQSRAPNGDFAAVSAGGAHSCALTTAGAAQCWGDNSYKQSTPTEGIYAQISAGGQHTCAVTTAGEGRCWGNTKLGRSNVPTARYLQISAGSTSSCGVTTDKELRCWGDNTSGKASPPDDLASQVSVGKTHACAVTTTGDIDCWGSNSNGQLNVPAGTYSEVSAGGGQTCAVTSSGKVRCWGLNDSGQASVPDLVPPLPPTITSQIKSPISSKAADIAFTGLAGLTAQCSLDDGAWSNCSSPKRVSDLAEGQHTIRVRQINGIGIRSKPDYETWTVDTIAPAAPSLSGAPNSPTKSTSASFGFTAEDGATLTCALDTAAYTPCSSPTAISSLTDGDHTFAVKATDAAGNSSAQGAIAWTVDTVAPAAPTFTSSPLPQSNTNSPTIAFSAESGAILACSLDGAAFTNCNSPKALDRLADGPHTFAVTATDAAGNKSAAGVTPGWTTDTVAPAAPTLSGTPPSVTASNGASISLSGEDKATFICSVDGAASYSPCATPKVLSALSDGTHSLSVKTQDQAGNLSVSATASWKVDTTPPAPPKLTGIPPGSTKSRTASIGFTSEPGATFMCSRDDSDFKSCTSPESMSSLPDGRHSLVVRAVDSVGNTGTGASVIWSVDNVALPPTVTPPLANTSSPSISFAGETDATFSCSMDNGTFVACASPKALAKLTEGQHTFAVKQTDAAGNQSSLGTATWTVDTIAPTIQFGSGVPAAISNQQSATITFNSETGATFTCAVDRSPATPCVSPQSLSGLSDGAHSFTVKATDRAGNSSTLRTAWTTDTVAPAVPTVTSRPSVLTNSPLAAITFTADDDAAVTCALDGAVFSKCSSPLNLTALNSAPHELLIVATDAAGNASGSASVTWTTDTVAPALFGTPKVSKSGASDTLIQSARTTDSADATKLEYSLAATNTAPKTASPVAAQVVAWKASILLLKKSGVNWLRVGDDAGNWSPWYAANKAITPAAATKR